VGGETESKYELKRIRRVIGKPANQAVLEVGMGTGRIVRTLCNLGCRIVGLDINPRMIRHFNRKNRTNKVDLVIGDGQHLPFRRGVFDIVICFRVMKYFHKPQDALAEIDLALKSGGKLVVEFSNILAPTSLIIHLPQLLTLHKFYPRLYSLSQVRRWIGRLGLKTETVIPLQKIPGGVWNHARGRLAARLVLMTELAIERITPAEFLSRNLLVLATKSDRQGNSWRQSAS